MTQKNSTVHFVLVHGACHGGWSWYKIRCLLESIGHKVSCPDLSGCGTDLTNADTISSFDEYEKPFLDILSSLSEDEKVILVGHSAGGLSLTDAIHKFPEKIQAAVFVGASMLRNGFMTDQDRKDGEPDFSKYGEVYDYFYADGHGPDKPATSVIFKKEVQRKILYQMSPLEDCTLAAMLLRPCSTRSLAKFPDGGEDIDKVPRVYIKTLHDNVLTREQQDTMIKRWPPSDVFEIDSDHCPIFSNASVFVGLLLKVAAKFAHHH